VAGSRNAEKAVLAPHGVLPLAFAEPTVPPPKRPGEYILVFNGDMGEEKADAPSGSLGAVLGKIIAPRRYLAAGLGEHNLLADDGGGVWSWGDNEFGQLGNGGYNFVFPYGSDGPLAVLGPTTFPPLQGIVEVAKGFAHSLARKKDGTVWAWGSGYGVAQNAITFLPKQVLGLVGAAAVAAGTFHSIVARRDGSVWSWGLNDAGQLGNGIDESTSTPARVALDDVRAIAAGDRHSIALKGDGTVWAWGGNGVGEVGNGSFGASVPFPSQVVGVSDVIAIAAGASHGLALARDGSVWAWGANGTGQLGDGSVSVASPGGKSLPVRVAGLTDVVAIAAGGVHSIAARRDGTVWTWGNDFYGQLGNGTFGGASAQPTPVKVPGLENVVEVSGGFYHSLALRIDGTIWAWGRDWFGELGDGTTTTTSPYGKAAAVRTLITAF
jgi:alpha-tubulin suppressor-like RCC1 family protein